MFVVSSAWDGREDERICTHEAASSLAGSRRLQHGKRRNRPVPKRDDTNPVLNRDAGMIVRPLAEGYPNCQYARRCEW
jgi:hypothetical protein